MNDERRPGLVARFLLGLTHGFGLIAVIGLVFVGVLIGIVLAVAGPAADEGKARREVQRSYDARFPGRVEVDSCRYAPLGDSDYGTFSCSVKLVCQRSIAFSVPRAAGVARADVDPARSDGRRLRAACR